jgi:DNA-binding LacI/PurR family transcriptional regulator
MSKIPTIRELAVLAGVSRTTVSLALRNSPKLPAETRERILDLAAKKGYVPDPLVSTLMNRLRTNRAMRSAEKLAYLTWWNYAEEWRSSPNEVNYYEGARERAAQLGYELEHIWAREPKMTFARLSKILYTRAIRGVILAPLLRAKGHVSLDWQHFSAAAISFTLVRPDLHRVSHGHYGGMLLIMRKLRHLGYRRIGLAIFADQLERVNNAWLAGFLVSQEASPLRNRVPHLLMPRPCDFNKFRVWVDQHRPDVIISNTTEPLDFLGKMGLRIPQDIGYASLDRVTANDPWAGIDQQARIVGGAAVELVSAQLQHNEFGLPSHPKTIMLDGVWRDGPTVLSRRPGKEEEDDA